MHAQMEAPVNSKHDVLALVRQYSVICFASDELCKINGPRERGGLTPLTANAAHSGKIQKVKTWIDELVAEGALVRTPVHGDISPNPFCNLRLP